MSKLALLVLLFAACTESDAVVVDDTSKADDYGARPPLGRYQFEPTYSGAPQVGDISSLTLMPSRTFELSLEDEWSGTTTHRGQYQLYRSSDGISHFIDFTETGHTTRYEYSVDVIDNSTLWMRASTSQRVFAMSHLGDDCRTTGCASGSACNECWGEYVCLAAGTSC